MAPGRADSGRILAVCWFRRDLRLSDNGALAAALSHALEHGGRVAAVFVFDTDILGALPDRDDRRVGFIVDSVLELDGALRTTGGSLEILHGSARREIPAFVAALGRPVVFASGDHEPFGAARDAQIGRELSAFGSALRIVHDHAVFAPDRILTGSGTPFRVFTPYFRAWSAALEREPDSVLAMRDSVPRAGEIASGDRSGMDASALLARIGFKRGSPAVAGGESGARSRLERFLAHVGRYGTERDLPAVQGTSRLSVDLRFGTISVRELVRAGRQVPGEGAAKWISEIAWRDFYQAVLAHFPRTVDHAFQERLEAVVWDDPDTDSVARERFAAWCEGRTGYPFVDAAMRELYATGWMHNRCRMVVASFLAKDLHIHWKKGERWFARWLLDVELASNVGGWQWSAGTGADAQPWFRIFNPVEQGKRWDPSGAWIRQWCPELAGLPDKWIHAPWLSPAPVLREAGVELDRNWRSPVVDHAAERLETLERFGRIARGA